MADGLLEISDLIVDFEPQTLDRRPVSQEQVVERLRAKDQHRAAHIVAQLPASADGVLDPRAVDRLLVRVHCEMQRLSEEFQHGQRMAEFLQPLLPILLSRRKPITVADIGCGTGYVIRWLSAHRALGPEVRLVGFDYNGALLEEASRLARVEGLDCRFVRGDAFGHELDADFYISTGVIHHFRGAALADFFRAHDQTHAAGFAHVDFQPSWIGPFGAWLFHMVRMRERLARHDGVASVRRVHDGETLLAAAGQARGFDRCIYGARIWGLPLKRVFHTTLGIRSELRSAVEAAIGSRRRRLGPWR